MYFRPTFAGRGTRAPLPARPRPAQIPRMRRRLPLPASLAVGLPATLDRRAAGRRPLRGLAHGYVERVGVASVLEPGRPRAGELPTVVAGVVVDTTTGAPLAGARVVLPGEPPAVTDAAGRYTIRVSNAPDDSVVYALGVSISPLRRAGEARARAARRVEHVGGAGDRRA